MKLFSKLFSNEDIEKIFNRVYEEEIKHLRANINLPTYPLDDIGFYKGSPMTIYIRYDFKGSRELQE